MGGGTCKTHTCPDGTLTVKPLLTSKGLTSADMPQIR